jgi:hypothetical protein
VTISCAALAQGVSLSASDNPTLTHLFEVDQAARQGKDIDWSKLRVEDEDRRLRIPAESDQHSWVKPITIPVDADHDSWAKAIMIPG